VLSLDLSLTATGWAKSDGSSGVIAPPMKGYERLAYILDRVINFAEKVDLIAIEGFAFGAKGDAMLQLAGLGTLVRFTLWEAKYTLVEIPPSNLKMFAAGSGNAKKDDVLGAAIRILSYARNDHNEADALWLLEMTRAHYDGRELTAKQRQALSKIHWPALTSAHGTPWDTPEKKENDA
jgi:crossover junction endodeoxyribonuclease RuvC